MNSTFASLQYQFFAFPPDVITHLWKYPLSANGLQKLHQTCKYFFTKQPIFVFQQRVCYTNSYNFTTNADTIIKSYMNAITEKWTLIKSEKTQYWLNNHLSVRGPNCLPKNIFRCSLKSLHLCHTQLTMKEFDLLAGENTINRFNLLASDIMDSEGIQEIPIDATLQKLPNVVLFDYIKDEHYSDETLKNLKAVKLNQKLTYLGLLFQNHKFNFSLMCDFLQHHMADDSKIEFFTEFDEEALDPLISKLMDKWEGKKKPTFTVKLYDP